MESEPMARSRTLRPSAPLSSLALAGALAALPAALAGQQGASTPPTFKVDTSWPQALPADWNWDHGPDTRGSDVLGIRADAQDHIWVTSRGTVAEYDPDGKLLQSWSAREDGKYTTIHGMWRDHDGNIWTTGREQHVVLEFTPTGELIKSIGVYDETRGSDDKETMASAPGRREISSRATTSGRMSPGLWIWAMPYTACLLPMRPATRSAGRPPGRATSFRGTVSTRSPPVF